ncbi:hypothetical protein A2223_04730 [Candidatus Falkowbacteria bacterium RIFOXYA2_FULL_35_8]|nr:MAG: hypothetical protein A2223_04730 [Candidatus Falkowbacteria bacterium RIFOXYA2_FULL_35_8]
MRVFLFYIITNIYMKTTHIKFPVLTFRKIAAPEMFDSSRSEIEEGGEGATLYVATIDARQLPRELQEWRKINPRESNPNSRVSKDIRKTLEEAPLSFILRNRGLTILAQKTFFDNKENVLSLEMSDQELHGLLDGGHTFEVLRDFLDNLQDEDIAEANVLLKLEIIEGVAERDAVVNIVAARNTSAQVKEQSLENLRGSFDKIKTILQDTPYVKNISFKETEFDEEGDKKEIDIRDILSYLICFDIEGFSGDNHPVFTYSQKSEVVEYFKRNKDRLDKYIDLLPVILELHDKIYLDMPDSYNTKTGGSFGRLTGVIWTKNKKRMQEVLLPFIQKKSEYKIPSGFIYPAIAAFRSNIQVVGNKATWKINPLKILPELIEDIAEQVGKQSQEFRNPNKLGKNQATWSLCYFVVERALFRRDIK